MFQTNLTPTIRRLMFLSIFCIALEVLRMCCTFTLNYIFLPWNLILAWVPLVFAIQIVKEENKRRLGAWLFAWFIFFPNAPYIITDFLHLKPRDNFPFWFDSILLYAFAFAGLMTGVVSALLVYKKLNELMPKYLAKGIMVVVMFFSGYGIYIGRFLRYNSWDILTDPFEILGDTAARILHPFSYPRTYGVTLMAGVLLCLVLAVFESFMEKETA